METYKLINNIQENDISSENIYNSQGHLLIKAGTKLNSTHIKSLKKNFIEGIFILLENEKEIVIPPQLRQKIREFIISKLVFSNFEIIEKDTFNDLIEMGILYYATSIKDEINQ